MTRTLGEGGMAIVSEAYDFDLQMWRAVKFLKPELSGSKSLRRRFINEARALAKLDHPHIVRVFDVGEEGTWPYFVMGLSRGGSLQDWLDDHGAMPAALALDAILQVCRGVELAHEHGIVHRDIKPDNVLLTVDGRCQVTDFGIAQNTTDASFTRTNSKMGTLGYMAPEQYADAKHVDQRADVFGIGATFFALLTGREPSDLGYAAHSPEMLDGVDPVFRPTLLKAIAYDADHRWPDVASFRAALEALRDQLPPIPAGVQLGRQVLVSGDVPHEPVDAAPTVMSEDEEALVTPEMAALPYRMSQPDDSEGSYSGGVPSYIDTEWEEQIQQKEAAEKEAALERQRQLEEEAVERRRKKAESERPAAPRAVRESGSVLEAAKEMFDGAVALFFRLARGPLAFVAIALAIPTVLGGGLILVGLIQVRTAGAAVYRAQSQLAAAIEHEARLLDDLEAMGAGTAVLRAKFEQLPKLEEPDRGNAGVRYVSECRTTMRMHEGKSPPEALHREKMAETRIGRLEDAVLAHQGAMLAWERAADGGLGGFACSFPVGVCPP